MKLIQYLEAAASLPICGAEAMRMRKAKLFTRTTRVSIRTQRPLQKPPHIHLARDKPNLTRVTKLHWASANQRAWIWVIVHDIANLARAG